MGWFGLFTHAGVTPACKALLKKHALAAVKDPAVAKRIADSGSIPNAMAGQEFATFIGKEVKRLGEVVRSAGIEAA